MARSAGVVGSGRFYNSDRIAISLARVLFGESSEFITRWVPATTPKIVSASLVPDTMTLFKPGRIDKSSALSTADKLGIGILFDSGNHSARQKQGSPLDNPGRNDRY